MVKRNGLRKPMPKISGRVLSEAANRFPDGIVYVVPTPGGPSGISIGLMRRILPLRSFVLAAVRCASQYSRPVCSSIGLYPSESNGFVLSPVEAYRLPSGPKYSEPLEWQHWAVWWLNVRIFCSELRSSVSPLTL